jgi:hypothetical protein
MSSATEKLGICISALDEANFRRKKKILKVLFRRVVAEMVKTTVSCYPPVKKGNRGGDCLVALHSSSLGSLHKLKVLSSEMDPAEIRLIR